MNILALDTSTEFCSVALLQNDGRLLSEGCHAGQRHSEILLPMIETLLASAGITVAGLNGIAFGIGPGSFTGLRIACGVAQGLALGTGLPVVGVTTLEAMALATGRERVVACLDARMGEIYSAVYSFRDGAAETISDPGLYAPSQVPLPPGSGWFGCGSGFSAHGAALAARFGAQVTETDGSVLPHAREIARLALPRFERGEAVDAADAAPLYLRNKVALTTRERSAP